MYHQKYELFLLLILITYHIKYNFMAGRGIGCESNLVRTLEDGVLPILNAKNTDNNIIYETQYFVTNEFSPLDKEHVEGTEVLVADAHGAGHMFTPEQQEKAAYPISATVEGTE